jgi:ATP-binding cassette subfamily F protein uup
VVTSSLVFEGNGRVNEYVGGYSDWLRQRRPHPVAGAPAGKRPSKENQKPRPPANKLSYKDQRELDSLPRRIEALETTIEELHARMTDPAFYQLSRQVIAAEKAHLLSAESDLQSAYQRWEELEQMRNT